jgi:hypothetical protein
MWYSQSLAASGLFWVTCSSPNLFHQCLTLTLQPLCSFFRHLPNRATHMRNTVKHFGVQQSWQSLCISRLPLTLLQSQLVQLVIQRPSSCEKQYEQCAFQLHVYDDLPRRGFWKTNVFSASKRLIRKVSPKVSSQPSTLVWRKAQSYPAVLSYYFK